MTLRVVLVTLATFRATRFVVDDSFPPWLWFRTRLVRVGFLEELLSCYWCSSIWIAAGVTVLADRWLAGGLVGPALVALAASGITGIIATVLPD